MPRPNKTKFWQLKKFRELQKKWDKKLTDSGFIDAERNGRLIQNAANSYRTTVDVLIEGKQRYYELLGQWYHDEKFNDVVEAFVMQQRSKGVSVKKIRAALRKRGKRNGADAIRRIIRFYENKWQIKKKKR